MGEDTDIEHFSSTASFAASSPLAHESVASDRRRGGMVMCSASILRLRLVLLMELLMLLSLLSLLGLVMLQCLWLRL